MKRKFLSGLLVLLLLVVSPAIACAENSAGEADGQKEEYKPKKTYEVKFPSFKIIINNVFVDNGKSKYPVLVYEGVTYFPMTWGFTQALGLEVEWDEEEGFAINRSEQQPTRLINESAIISAKHLYAKLPDFPIRINKQVIDNDNEEFPVLVFNDVTYFPMTWKFAVEELGLTISMNNDKFYISKQ